MDAVSAAPARAHTSADPERDRLRIADLVFDAAPLPIMVTDSSARIIRVNQAFSEVTGYVAAEVLGTNPRILSSGRHDRAFYQKMWETLIATGAWEGEIWNRRKNGEIFPEVLAISTVLDDNRNVSHYIGMFRDITTRKEREARLQHLSQHDPLTDLPNRTLFMDRLDQAIRRARRMEQRFALMFIDLDRFKAINDSCGHLAGDQTLQEVATRLRMVVRDMDTVARVGGDEFAVILPEVSARAPAAALASRILDALARPVVVAGQSFTVRCSIGVCIGPGHDGTAEEFLHRADAAMYNAKRDGGASYTFSD